mmetsp:Transcript_27595/g.36199  ORF Transcript_27595/g.36199 Transcript_27595/m.36199 type:complete len:262 (-) Transcript_27595:101-886(-)
MHSNYFLMIEEHGVSLLCISLFSVITNVLCKKFGPQRKVDGFGLWNWMMSLFWQFVIYPYFAIAAWKQKDFGMQWLYCGWDDFPSMFFEKGFHYAFFGYLIKDMWELRSDFLFMLHHIICLLGIMVSFSLSAGVGFTVWIVFILETGTASFNCKKIWSDNFAVSRAYHCVMTLSNSVALVILFFFCQIDLDLFTKTLCIIIIMSLLIGRQQEVFLDIKKAQRKVVCAPASSEQKVGCVTASFGPATTEENLAADESKAKAS